MPVYTKKFITRKFMQEHPDWYFVFGDNLDRYGFGGQAKEMRGEPNAIGVATKAKASHNKDAYLHDDNPYHDFEVLKDLEKVQSKLKEGSVVVFPTDGIGTGLAKLEEKAPQLFEYIQNRIQTFKDEFGYLGELN